MPEAYARLNQDLAKVKAYLQQKGIPEKDIVVSSINTMEIRKFSEKGILSSEIEGYKLTQSVEITSGEVDRITEIFRASTELINQGVQFQSQPPEYFYTKLNDLKIDMLGEASKDARRRAEQLVANSGGKIGPLRSSKMGVFQITRPNSNEVSDYGIYDTSSLEKEITAVVNAEFYVKQTLRKPVINGGTGMKNLGTAIPAVFMVLFLTAGWAYANEAGMKVEAEKIKALELKIDPPKKINFDPVPLKKHWVLDDLAAFKQALAPVFNSGPEDGILTEEGKGILRNLVFNRENLNRPVETGQWALLIRILLQLPPQKSEQLLKMYVYDLAGGNVVPREDAAGGLVKLLTVKPYLRGYVTAEELKPSMVLQDLNEISEKQRVLVQKAYCEGILDATVKDRFRPKDPLTVAEAVSMLSRVVKKYGIDLDHSRKTGNDPDEHWAGRMFKESFKTASLRVDLFKRAESIVLSGDTGLDRPVTIDKWNDLLMAVLEPAKKNHRQKFLESYTYGLSDGKYIARSKAVAGMVKLLHAAELVRGRDATEGEIKEAASKFTDFDGVFDKSKLAIAFTEGLIFGYPDRSFRPDSCLTNGEALALVVKIINKYL